MTTVNEISQADTPKLKTNYENSQGITSALSTNYKQTEIFQKQIEEAVTRRFELLCNLYLEQIKFCENVVDSSNNLQQNGFSKMGLRMDTWPEFQNIVDAWNTSLRSWYSNQTRYSEVILKTLQQNIRTTNMNIEALSKMVWSNLTWWIPPTQK